MEIPVGRTDIPIAIVGMACRLPGADNLDQFWRLLSQGGSAVVELPPDRLDQELYYDPRRGQRGKSYSKLGAIISSRQFNRQTCPIPEELERGVDHVHLLMCETAAAACRHARLDPFNLPLRNTGVYIGHAQGSNLAGDFTYATCVEEAAEFLREVPGFQQLPAPQQEAIIRDVVATVRKDLPERSATSPDVAINMVAGVISKAFGLSGPFMAVNSACASSLQSLLLGVRALQFGRIDMAIVGGASDCKSDSLVLFSHAQSMSSTGSRPFDATADGLICSEGYVALVLKTLERALADGDPIQAVVLGLGASSDGRGKSLWAPRKEGQIKAMERAYRHGLDMSTLQYIEAHATSTNLGDATELNALTEVLAGKIAPGKKIPVTSVKANIGHALEAAGISSVIKSILCLQNKTFVPAINIQSLNSKINWDTAPFYIPRQLTPWPEQTTGLPRRAAVNAFGIGGLNVHVILEEFNDARRAELAGCPLAIVGGRVAPRPPRTTEPEADAVAVIGMGCILPGALDSAKFWDLLSTRRDPKGTTPAGRWRADIGCEPGSRRPFRTPTTLGGYITDFVYDWRKHKEPPKQVQEADPLQFMLLEAADQAVIAAGYDKKDFDRTRVGVLVGTEFGSDFSTQLELGLRLPHLERVLRKTLVTRGVAAEQAGQMAGQFTETLLKHWPALVDESGSFSTSTLASRITKTMNLMGGAAALDSSDTSAAAALASSSDLLLSGDCDMMVCAAGQRCMALPQFEAMSLAGVLATSDRPRSPLDASAAGILPGEGVGVLLLKRLSDARRDGDRIHAIIRGIGAAHAYSAEEAIRTAIERAFQIARVEPADVAVMELDGTGLPATDQEQIRAILSVYGRAPRKEPLALSSVVGQIGHTIGASAMVSFLKAAMEVESGQVPAAQGLETPLAIVAENSGTIRAATTSQPIRLATHDGRRLAAVNSYGKGLAYHIVLERGEKVAVEKTASTPAVQHKSAVAASVGAASTPAASAGSWQIYRLGAATPSDLTARLQAAMSGGTAWTAAPGTRFAPADRVRLAVVANSAESLVQKLQSAGKQLGNPAAWPVLEQQGCFYREISARRPRIAFLFPGQGSQYAGMLRELVRDVPAAAEMMRQLDAVMVARGFQTFAQMAWDNPAQLGADIWVTQVVMLLADLIVHAAIADQGIWPDLISSHSYGEYAALAAAGVWSLEDVVTAARARYDGIMATPGARGNMLATTAPPQLIEQLAGTLGDRAYIANYNAPDQSVIGGRAATLTELARLLEAQGHKSQMLAVPCPFHTPLMQGSSAVLERTIATLRMRPPRVPFLSSVTNRYVSDPQEIRANLAAQLTSPVRYQELVQRMAGEEETVLVEIGPQQALTRLNRRIVEARQAGGAPIVVPGIIAYDNPKRPGIEQFLHVRALLECTGAIDTQVPAEPIRIAPSTTPPSMPKVAAANAVAVKGSIVHVDATERRRDKMRHAAASDAAKSEGKYTVSPAAAPANGNGSSGAAHAHPQRATRLAEPQPPRSIQPPASPPMPSAPRMPQRVPVVAVPQSPPTPAPAIPATAAVLGSPAEPRRGMSAPSDPAAQLAAATGPNAADLEKFLINFVVEHTGYPPEVVELDADLEADLGIDSIKKAQLFGELAEYFDVQANENLTLDDFPSLRHVLKFLAGAPTKSDLGGAPTAASVVVAPLASSPIVVAAPVAAAAVAAPAPSSTTRQAVGAPNSADLEKFLINFVVEHTGYPPEVVELDADLEADLGIDSIKKAQLFGELAEYFDVQANENLTLDDFPTLRHVLNFLAGAPAKESVAVAASSPGEPSRGTPTSNSTAARLAASTGPAAAELEKFLVNFVVEHTGYPPEVVELDADLEADLGIDSIKKAQLFGELAEYFDVQPTDDLTLDDFPTLRHVLEFLQGTAFKQEIAAEVADAVPVATSAPSSPQSVSNAVAEPSYVAAAATTAASASVAAPATGRATAPSGAELEKFLVNFVVEHTGYPPEVVELDADLEADLGIDSIKKAQLFGELAEYFDVQANENLTLDDFPTLRHVLDFLLEAELKKNLTPNPIGSLAGEIPSAPERKPSFQAASQVEVESPRVPRLSGTPFEIGFQHGQQLKLQIRRILRVYADLVGTPHDPAQALSNARDLRARFTADELDEIQGIADGAGVPLDNLLVHNLVIRDRPATQPLDELAVGTADDLPRTDPLAGCVMPLVIERCPIGAAPQICETYVGAAGPAIIRPADESLSPLCDLADDRNETTHRFVLTTIDWPLDPATPDVPAWAGAALIVGRNSLVDALRAKLQASGVVVRELMISDDLDVTLAEFDRLWNEQPLPHLFLMTGRDAELADPLDEASWNRRWYRTAVLPYFLAQRWVQRTDQAKLLDRSSIVAAISLGGDFGFSTEVVAPECGALTGLIKAIYIEVMVMRGFREKGMVAKAIDAPDDEPLESLAANMLRDIASKSIDYEVAYVGGKRRVQYAYPEQAPLRERADIRPGGVWIATGGARGITAACALELGRRFGLTMHLIGATPLRPIDPSWRNLSEEGIKSLKATVMREARASGQSMDEAWSRVQKEIEIDRSLQAMKAAGVNFAYHACDVSDQQALSHVLDEIRRTSGPIEGILHGAGIERSGSFERKKRESVLATLDSKVTGALNLIRLTRRDPVRHFVGFGSISGRLGSNGQTDYCLASDALCKLAAWYRQARPAVRAVGFHWHSWEEVGMAARPDTAAMLKMGDAPVGMPKQEGLNHLVRELYAGAPAAEVLITNWEYHGRYYGTADHPKAEIADSVSFPAQVETALTTDVTGWLPPISPRIASRWVLEMKPSPLPPGSPEMPQLDGPVCILGNNRSAVALRDRLAASGVAVHMLPVSTSPEEVMAALEAIYIAVRPRHLFLMNGRDDEHGSLLDPTNWQRRRALGVVVPYLVTQHWFKLRRKAKDTSPITVAAAVSLGGDFGLTHRVALADGGAVAGLLKSLYIEDTRKPASEVRIKVIDAPAAEPPAAVADAILRELAAHDPEVEAAWSEGKRRVVRTVLQPVESLAKRPVPRGSVWVATGGARGITAAVAFEIGKRFGAKLHLIGRSPAPQSDAPWRDCSEERLREIKADIVRKAVAAGQSPERDWERVMFDIEIYKSLRKFAEAGVQATYHSCDLADGPRLAEILDEIRRQDGPIAGIVHGAGWANSGRFDTRNRNYFERTLSGKLDGAANLMMLTRQDPLRYFIGFGSISGRYGGNGLSDYAAANDMLAKLIDRFRAERPECTAACIHWQSWDEIGMAMLGDSAVGTKNVLKMEFISPAEGVDHLCRELEAGLPSTEVLITDGFFERTFYPFIGAEPTNATAIAAAPSISPLPSAGEGPGVRGSSSAKPELSKPPYRPLVESIAPLNDHQGIIAEINFDPTTDPFLLDHQLRGKPLLPAVVGMESMAEAAELATGKNVAAIHNIEMVDGLLFHTERKVVARVRAVTGGSNSVQCELISDFFNRAGKLMHKDRVHQRSTVELSDAPAMFTIPMPEPVGSWQPFEFVNNGPLYHGPTLHGVRDVALDEHGGWGRLVALSLAGLGGERAGRDWIVPATLLDAGFYVCGIHAWCIQQAFTLPHSVACVRLGRMARENESCLVQIACRASEAQKMVYDFTIIGEDRTAIVAVERHCVTAIRQ